MGVIFRRNAFFISCSLKIEAVLKGILMGYEVLLGERGDRFQFTSHSTQNHVICAKTFLFLSTPIVFSCTLCCVGFKKDVLHRGEKVT